VDGVRLKVSAILALFVPLISDCRAASHPDCRDLVPLPCIPTAVTPGGTKHVSVASESFRHIIIIYLL